MFGMEFRDFFLMTIFYISVKNKIMLELTDEIENKKYYGVSMEIYGKLVTISYENVWKKQGNNILWLLLKVSFFYFLSMTMKVTASGRDKKNELDDRIGHSWCLAKGKKNLKSCC